MRINTGKYTLLCRVICTALIFWPLVYRMTVEHGSAVEFLILILLAALAGAVLLLNSLYCLFRYRTWSSGGISVMFIAVSAIGFAVAWHYLPQFRM